MLEHEDLHIFIRILYIIITLCIKCYKLFKLLDQMQSTCKEFRQFARDLQIFVINIQI